MIVTIKRLASLAALVLFGLAGEAASFDDTLDRVDAALTGTAFKDYLRWRVSGTLDLEAYYFDGPAPGVIDTDDQALFNPRLTFFLDVQAGSKLYLFVQARADRGFDPGEGPAQIRADEYALRFTPWEDGLLSAQVGKFGTVVGSWMARHLSWDNPFVNAPLPYENMTAVSEFEPPSSPQDFVLGPIQEKYDFNPVVWGPVYTTGAMLAGRVQKLEYAAEVKNASISSRPDSWDVTEIGFDNPTLSGRLGFRPNATWNVGLSASHGAYFHPDAVPDLPPGRGRGDYAEILIGQDIGFALGHLQLWAEFFETRFQVPNVGNADTFAYYIEAKYKLSANWFVAARWNQQFFADIPDGQGGERPWGEDLTRIDLALGWRFTAYTQVKLQWSPQVTHSPPRDFDNSVAAQFTLRF